MAVLVYNKIFTKSRLPLEIYLHTFAAPLHISPTDMSIHKFAAVIQVYNRKGKAKE